MTLNWSKTASDCAVAQRFTALLDGKVWHDGLNWYMYAESSWNKCKAWEIARLMYETCTPFATEPYWRRTRHRLGMSGSQYGPVRIMYLACREGLLAAPEGFPEVHTDKTCLCGTSCYYEKWNDWPALVQ